MMFTKIVKPGKCWNVGDGKQRQKIADWKVVKKLIPKAAKESDG